MNTKNKKIFFSKMHGIGNDFVVFDKINQDFHFSNSVIKKIAHRNRGIGCDQILFVEKTFNKKFDFFYRIFNADGSEASQCGNGARCFAYFVYLKKLTVKKNIIVQTIHDNLTIQLINKNNIIVNMGVPKFSIDHFLHFSFEKFQLYTIKINNLTITFSLVFVGNLHCVIFVKDIENCNIHMIGDFLNNSELFYNGVNVNFVQIISPNYIKLRVYERGVGETQACGSGACASVVMGILKKKLQYEVLVLLPGGHLKIFWKGIQNNMYMKGPAEHVYDGFIKSNF